MMPVLRDVFQKQPAFQSLPEGSATAAAGVTAGLLAATASQPADTVKTRMQAPPLPPLPLHAAARGHERIPDPLGSGEACSNRCGP